LQYFAIHCMNKPMVFKKAMSWWTGAFVAFCLILSEHACLFLMHGGEFQPNNKGPTSGSLVEELLEGEQGALQREAILETPQDSLSLILSELPLLPYHPKLAKDLFRPPRPGSPRNFSGVI